MAMNYQAHYPDSPNPKSVEDGLKFQDFMMDWLRKEGIFFSSYVSRDYQYKKGESPQRIEIKFDQDCSNTGRLSVEVAERSSTKIQLWTPSGIFRDDNAWWYIQGNYTIAYLFNKNTLKEYFLGIRHKETQKKFGTIETFYMGLRDAERLCVHKFLAEIPGQYKLFGPMRIKA